MKKSSCESVKLSRFHTGRHHFLKITHGHLFEAVPFNAAADLAGVSPRTLERWCNGTQAPPVSALQLYRAAYLGWMPWEGWEDFRMARGLDNNGTLRRLLTHNLCTNWWAPERLFLQAYDYNRAQDLQRTVDALQATITALSTRQPPPIPCAEIIPLAPYLQTKKSPA